MQYIGDGGKSPCRGGIYALSPSTKMIQTVIILPAPFSVLTPLFLLSGRTIKLHNAYSNHGGGRSNDSAAPPSRIPLHEYPSATTTIIQGSHLRSEPHPDGFLLVCNKRLWSPYSPSMEQYSEVVTSPVIHLHNNKIVSSSNPLQKEKRSRSTSFGKDKS